MQQNTIKSPDKSRTSRIRRGRGNGSKGTYSGRGMKGQNARSGGSRRPGFEGGQTPLYRKMPKLKGFKNINQIDYQVVNIAKLNIFDDNTTVEKELLLKHRLITKKNIPVKILGQGKLEKKLTIKVEKASKTATEIISKAGGTFESTAHATKKNITKKPERK